MICIVNVSKPPTSTGWNNYEVRINSKVVAKFRHKREDGLANCLKQAMMAVERAKWSEVKKLLDDHAPPV